MNTAPTLRASLSTLRAPLLMMLVVLAGCQSAPTRLYTLSADVTAAPRSTYGGPPIRVDSVRFPPDLDRIEIVHDAGFGELRVSDVDHWSAPLGELARQALSGDLLARLPAGKTVFPHLMKPAGACGVSVDVLDFEADRQGARLQASWTVTGNGGTPSANGGTVTLREDLPATNAAAVAQSLSALLGQLADHIVAQLAAPE